MFDLDIRSSRLDKEQQKRREEARKKRERELALQKEQERRERELAERAAQRREEEEREQMIRQLAEAEEQKITGGIRFTHRMTSYVIDGEDDKVILPEDCLSELTQEDAFIRGAMCFRLQWTDKEGAVHTTHCGVREFSAPAGSIGMPKKVLDSLSIPSETTGARVEIKYVLLPKCTFAKLQPRHNAFIEVGPVKMCLEENLRFHTTLSVGDVLTVWYRGKAHELCVMEMRPEPCGTLVDTDVEIDLELSQEYLQHQQQQQQQQSSQDGVRRLGGGGSGTGSATGSAAGSRAPSPNTALPQQSQAQTPALGKSVFHTLGGGIASGTHSRASSTGVPPSASTSTTTVAPEEVARWSSGLQPEPDATGGITVKVKLPSGATKTRRFTYDSPVAQLFLFVALEVHSSTGEAPIAVLQRLQLSTRFPARSLRWPEISSSGDSALSEAEFTGGASFADLGMTGASEAVFATLL